MKFELDPNTVDYVKQLQQNPINELQADMLVTIRKKLAEARHHNKQMLFESANYYGVEYMFVGHQEIYGNIITTNPGDPGRKYNGGHVIMASLESGLILPQTGLGWRGREKRFDSFFYFPSDIICKAWEPSTGKNISMRPDHDFVKKQLTA